jgi:hypothetical protein
VIAEEIVSKWVPATWEAFLDYKRHSISLSRAEVLLMGAIAAGDRKGFIACTGIGLLDFRRGWKLTRE